VEDLSLPQSGFRKVYIFYPRFLKIELEEIIKMQERKLL